MATHQQGRLSAGMSVAAIAREMAQLAAVRQQLHQVLPADTSPQPAEKTPRLLVDQLQPEMVSVPVHLLVLILLLLLLLLLLPLVLLLLWLVILALIVVLKVWARLC